MIYADLEQALINALRPLVPDGIAVSWPNAELGVGKGDVWWDVDNLFSETTPVTLGDKGEDQVDGFFQVLFKTKPHRGGKQVLTMCDTVASHFKAGDSFTFGKATVIIKGATARPGFTSGEYYTVPLSIRYYARYARR